MSGNLTAELTVRMDEATRAELDRRAAASDRKPSELARRLIRQGLGLEPRPQETRTHEH